MRPPRVFSPQSTSRPLKGKLQANKFAGELHYFRSRYFDNGESTPRFAGLNLRANDSRDMVRTVLAGANDNAADVVAALLIVVYRLRNNLFTGPNGTAAYVTNTVISPMQIPRL